MIIDRNVDRLVVVLAWTCIFLVMQLKDFREEMNKIKSPFMERIRNSTQMFQTKIKLF